VKRKPGAIDTVRTAMRERPPLERRRNFDEVSIGFTEDEALREAARCLRCKKPGCVEGCPVSIGIPEFIERIAERDYEGAYRVLSQSTLLPAVCGRVCPQERQCEGRCAVGKKYAPVAIGALERFAGDMAISNGWTTGSSRPALNGRRVGVIGSGPAGLACAADMVRAGCEVTIFEALHEPGGVLRYGIPEFRLPNSVVDAEIGKLSALGVKTECDTLAGRMFTIEQMMGEMGFDAVFVAVGAGYPVFPRVPGDALNGVISANELLTRCNLMAAHAFPETDTPMGIGRKVAVIGAGNTAMDAMRVSLRLGAEQVFCLYRRGEEECPARAEELRHAKEEGIVFHWLTAPVEILGDENGHVRAVRCIGTKPGEPDASGRRRPVPVPGSEREFEADTIVYAIGTNANPIIGRTCGIRLTEKGYIAVDDELQTSIPGVFAGGDIVTGAATVILAMGAGRKAARGMRKYLGI